MIIDKQAYIFGYPNERRIHLQSKFTEANGWVNDTVSVFEQDGTYLMVDYFYLSGSMTE